ncbi:MAG: hypothetical protein ACI9DC_005066 [Gammaproteobacteria bacterium]|jgi:hypothetical protein
MRTGEIGENLTGVGSNICWSINFADIALRINENCQARRFGLVGRLRSAVSHRNASVRVA